MKDKKIRSVEEDIKNALQVFNNISDIGYFLNLHRTTIYWYIKNNKMPFTARSKLLKETNRRLKMLTD